MFKKFLSLFLVLSIVLPASFLFPSYKIAQAQCGVLAPGSDEWWASGCNLEDPDLNGNGGGGSGGGSGGSSGTSAKTLSCKLDNNARFQDLITYVNCIINLSIIPLLFTLATLFFIWGVVQYMLADADERKRETGKQYMVWGIVALTVMISVWGLVSLLGNTFGLDTGFVPQIKP